MDSQKEESSSKSSASIFESLQQFRAMYYEQVEKSDDSYDGLKMRVRVLQKWVQDLMEQNDLLVKTVEELETDALQRLTLLEANITDNQKPQLPSTDSRVEHLCNDIRNLLELLRRFREDGYWYLNNLKFKIVTYEDIFGCPPEHSKYNNHCSDKSPRSFTVQTEKVAGKLRKCFCSKL